MARKTNRPRLNSRKRRKIRAWREQEEARAELVITTKSRMLPVPVPSCMLPVPYGAYGLK